LHLWASIRGFALFGEDQVAVIVAQTVAAFGRLEVAFNDAGIQVTYAGSADQHAEDFDRVNAVNYRGVWASMKYELRQMRSQGSGAIVNCSSIGRPRRRTRPRRLQRLKARRHRAHQKRGTRPHGVRINAVCPGTIDTPMVSEMVATGALDQTRAVEAIPIGRLGRPDEIAAAVLWLCGPGASFITGVALLVDGGQLA
jgi:NAD(P)-dependent dehydrogenase (short-subunit alcohol dehydrogenase family)